MKVLIDMNLSVDWVKLLVEHGHVAEHWQSLGDPGAGDDQLIAQAQRDGSAILTNDLDFGIELVTKRLSKPSVIQLRSDDLRPSTLGGAVLSAINEHALELERGVLITVDPRRSRFRLLQLGENPE